MAKRILIVDDEPGIVNLVTSLLVGKGYEVASAGDGESALQQIARVKPDLVLLDVMLPGMDGSAVAEELERRPWTADLPVVFLTSLVAGDETERTEHRIGGRLFLSKPFTLADLVRVVETALGSRA
jgi:CheY-like chemotaxis protein